MASAKAFVYAACEDFGIALVEAQACGTPVIAYQGGGASETVIDIRQDPIMGTGILFASQEPAAIVEAVGTFEELAHRFNPASCRTQATKFAPHIFQKTYLDYIASCSSQWSDQKITGV